MSLREEEKTMTKEEKIEYGLTLLLIIAITIVELEMTNDSRWQAFKASTAKKIHKFLYPFTKEYQKRKEIESIAKAMGYESEWLMPLLGGD